jgi:pimeloyl-ACP methyl ester carboxylesterase
VADDVAAVTNALGIDRFAMLSASGGGPHCLAAAALLPDTAADHAALAGEWGWLGNLAGQAMAGSGDGMVDDDCAYVTPWGFDPARITAPLLLVHGDEDRMVPCAHSRWLAGHCPTARLRVSAGDGHVSVLRLGEQAIGVDRRPGRLRTSPALP